MIGFRMCFCGYLRGSTASTIGPHWNIGLGKLPCACLDHLRVSRRERTALKKIAGAQSAWGLALGSGASQEYEQRVAAKELVRRLLAELAPEDRVVIQLLDLEELSVAQVAELLDRSLSWVTVRAHRARRWLEDTCRKLVED